MSKPKAGTRGVAQSIDGSNIGFTVKSVDGNLCWAVYDNDPGVSNPFIWRFRDGLNTMHDWPGKGDA